LEIFSTGTGTEDFTGIPGRGRDPKTRIGARFGRILPGLIDPFFLKRPPIGKIWSAARAVQYVREHGKITNKVYREMVFIGESLALRDLNDLVSRGVFLKVGKTGRSTEYVLNQEKADKPSTNPL